MGSSKPPIPRVGNHANYFNHLSVIPSKNPVPDAVGIFCPIGCRLLKVAPAETLD